MKLFNNNKDIILKNVTTIFKLNFKKNFYFGNFVNDIFNGKGIMLMKINNNNIKGNLIYKGNFKNDKKNGEGIIYFNKNNYYKICIYNDYILSYEKVERYFNNFEDMLKDFQKNQINLKLKKNFRKKPLQKSKIR